jgi:hypothetical protein
MLFTLALTVSPSQERVDGSSTGLVYRASSETRGCGVIEWAILANLDATVEDMVIVDHVEVKSEAKEWWLLRVQYVVFQKPNRPR